MFSILIEKLSENFCFWAPPGHTQSSGHLENIIVVLNLPVEQFSRDISFRRS